VNTSRTACRARNSRTALALAALAAFCCTLYAQASRSVWDGVYTQEQAKRGEAVYARECASCHGLALNGGESAPPLMGGEFLSSWNGLTVGDLFERIRTTMPADSPGRLTRAQNADVIAQILSANQFPQGRVELDTKVDVLKQIRVESSKP
jgi:mono/diheme cytochrome c family protein